MTKEKIVVVGAGMAGGRIVEDDAPRALANRADSRYRQLLDAEISVRAGLWEAAEWRRLRMDGGRVAEERIAEERETIRASFRASGGKASILGASR